MNSYNNKQEHPEDNKNKAHYVWNNESTSFIYGYIRKQKETHTLAHTNQFLELNDSKNKNNSVQSMKLVDRLLETYYHMYHACMYEYIHAWTLFVLHSIVYSIVRFHSL